MTDKEKAIVMAFTGVTMLTGEKFGIYHEYIEKVCGRPIWTHELANKRVMDEIKEKSKDDFLSVCRSEDPLDRVLEIIDSKKYGRRWNIQEELWNDKMDDIKTEVLALKGGDRE